LECLHGLVFVMAPGCFSHLPFPREKEELFTEDKEQMG
jgi:hypothetical protein